eukprot:2502757-Pyramimonas_sp.AAC.1
MASWGAIWIWNIEGEGHADQDSWQQWCVEHLTRCLRGSDRAQLRRDMAGWHSGRPRWGHGRESPGELEQAAMEACTEAWSNGTRSRHAFRDMMRSLI